MEERTYPYNKIGEPEIDNLLDQVEEALGFQLFIWQRQYILTGKEEWIGGRLTGKTTALILRELLIFTEDDEPLDLICPLTKRAQIYKEEMKKIQQKLDYFRIPTREVWYNKEYKALMQEKKRHLIEVDIVDLYPDTTKLLEQIQLADDDIVLTQLMEYGITRDNIMHNLHRIQVFSFLPFGEKECMKKRFLVDGTYAFTIVYKTALKHDGQTLNYSIEVEKEENV